MSNVTLNLNGVAVGTGAYNPIPNSFTANPSTMKLVAITGTVSKTLGIIPNLSSVWSVNPATITSTGTNLNFVETLRAGLPPTDALLRFIGVIGQPGKSPSGTLSTTITSTTGTLNILANNNG